MAKWQDEIEGHSLHPESLMMSYGYRPEWSEGAASSPIFQTSTFVFPDAAAGKRCFELAYGLDEAADGEQAGLIYSRLNNPDLEIAEDRLALWDRAEACCLFKSGMAAITTTLWSYLRPGDVLAVGSPIYGGTHHFVTHVLPEFGITPVRFGPDDGVQDIEAKIAAAGGRLGLVLIETPANPTNALFDVSVAAEVAGAHRTDDRPVPLAVDNTFLGPVFQSPLEHGADIVLYSATKYLGGHGDLIAGAALGSADVMGPVRAMRTFNGSMMGPWTGWLLMRSLMTLRIRMERQAATATTVARWLADHDKVRHVNHLSLIPEGTPAHALYTRQCAGPGAMISFEVDGGELEAFRFLDSLRLVKLAVSLGSVDSLAEHPSTMTHSSATAEEKAAAGIGEGLVRLSIGVEHPEDLLLDLEQALKAV
jgi:methionine-gamma-lyase